MEFLEHRFFYFILLFVSLLYPFAQSFERRISYHKKWRSLVPSIATMMLLFIPWDIWFTYSHIWHFNENYVCGYSIFLLPIVEWLFFVVIPFACVFIHEVLNYFFNKRLAIAPYVIIAQIIAFLLLILSIVYAHRMYTLVCFTLTSLSLFILSIYKPKWIGRFFRTYFVSLVPFLIINGFLTGSFTDNPIVIYDSTQIIGLRIFNIPVEDSMYSLLMLLIVICLFEKKNS